jgi:predicted hydrolase (HD superfamily)
MIRKLAERLGENGREWELIGLSRDLDHDETGNDTTKHGIVSVERLRSKLPEYCLNATVAHDYTTGIKPKTSSPLWRRDENVRLRSCFRL